MKTSDTNTPTESTSRFGHAVIEMLIRTVIILSATLILAAVAAHLESGQRVLWIG
jgi:hypothetical protein